MDTMLALVDHPLSGDSWEQICNSCYKMHYQDEHYTEIPALYKGDAGIEGFTLDGIVTQCYYPEKDYTDDDLYNHLRDKMTTDLNKLLSNGERLSKLGVKLIKEWHFIIPDYRDSRILEHAESKRVEILQKKKENPNAYNYISDDFRILIKTAENFRLEFTRLIRGNLTDIKLNLSLGTERSVDWSQCPSEKVENIRRKVKAIMGELSDEGRKNDYEDIVGIYIELYIKGLEIMRTLQEKFPDVYEDIAVLEQAYKKEVSIKTMLNTNKSINRSLFDEILDDFQKKIESEFSYITTASLVELKNELISGWLADCSMEFRG